MSFTSILDRRSARLALAVALMTLAVLASVAFAYAGSSAAAGDVVGGDVVLPVEPDGGIGGEIILPVEPDGGIGN